MFSKGSVNPEGGEGEEKERKRKKEKEEVSMLAGGKLKGVRTLNLENGGSYLLFSSERRARFNVSTWKYSMGTWQPLYILVH